MNRTAHTLGTPRAMLLATILAIGALVAWLVTCFIAMTIYQTLAPTDRLRFDQLVFTVEGQPLLQRYSPEGAQTGDLYVYRTLEGRRIEDPESVHLTEADVDELPIKSRPNFPDYNWIWRIHALLQTRPAPLAWYLVHDGRADGRAWFVGYQPQSKQRIGYLGRKGFRPDVPPADEQFVLSMSLFNDGGTAPQLSPGSSEPTGRFEALALYQVPMARC